MHHAYLIVDTLHRALTVIDEADTKWSVDHVCTEYEKFGIDEARQLKHVSSQLPIKDSHRVFVISVETITVEAQNALLKLFEEPPETTRFYLIVQNENILIDTLLSRLFKIGNEEKSSEVSAVAKKFLKLSFAERIEIIALKTKEKDTVWAENLLAGLEVYVDENKNQEIMSALVFVRKYYFGRSASKKMLLEHLAFSLPVVS